MSLILLSGHHSLWEQKTKLVHGEASEAILQSEGDLEINLLRDYKQNDLFQTLAQSVAHTGFQPDFSLPGSSTNP